MTINAYQCLSMTINDCLYEQVPLQVMPASINDCLYEYR